MADSKLGYEIQINEFETVCLFLGCKVSDKDKEADRIHEFCMHSSAEHFSLEPKKGENYGVFLQSIHRWVRGKLKEIFQHVNFTEYKMFLIDRGEYVTVRKQYLVLLCASMNYPPRCLRIGLDGVISDADLCNKYIVYITGLLHKGSVYFKEKRTIKNIVFGRITIIPHGTLNPIDLTTNLLIKGLIKDSDNFESDIMQFFREFKGFKEEFTFSEDDMKTHKQNDESKCEKLNEEKQHRIAAKQRSNTAKQDRITVKETSKIQEKRNYMKNISGIKSQPDTGYSSSDEECSKIPFVHEDVKFVPAGFHPPNKKKSDNLTKNTEIHIPRTHYEIIRDKEKAKTRSRSKSVGRSSEKSYSRTAHSKSLTREPKIPQERTVNQKLNSSQSNCAESDGTNSEKSGKKRVSWGSTVVQDHTPEIPQNTQTDQKITRAFNLNFKSARKSEDANHPLPKEEISGSDKISSPENKQAQYSESLLETTQSNNTSDNNEKNNSGQISFETTTTLSEKADSSSSSVDFSMLSRKEQMKLLKKVKLAKGESSNSNNNANVSTKLDSTISDRRGAEEERVKNLKFQINKSNNMLNADMQSSQNVDKSNVSDSKLTSSNISDGSNRSISSKDCCTSNIVSSQDKTYGAQISKSVVGLESRLEKVENTGNQDSIAGQFCNISGNFINTSNSSYISNNSAHITNTSAKSLNSSTNVSLSANSLNSSKNVSFSANSLNSSTNVSLSANSLNSSTNELMGACSFNSSGQSKSSFNLSGISSEGGSDISNLSKKQQLLLKRKNKIVNAASNKLVEEKENILSLQNPIVINNQVIEEKISTKEVSENVDKTPLPVKNDGERNEEKDNNFQETPKYFSEEEEKRKKMNELMAPGEEIRHLKYDYSQDDSYTTQGLLGNINVAAGVLVHTYDGRPIPAVSTLSESSLDPKVIKDGQESS